VISFVKNDHMGFLIPYTVNGNKQDYTPDITVRNEDGRGRDDTLSLIVEVTGARGDDKASKVATARNLWIPAVNNAGTWGRWDFMEIDDPWDAKNAIEAFLDT